MVSPSLLKRACDIYSKMQPAAWDYFVYRAEKDVASFLKRFIKTIIGNEPVITYNCYAPLVELSNSSCPSHLIAKKYRHIIGQLLVPARRLLLKRLCNFLH